MDSSDDFWRKIIAIHNHTKSLMILAEEVERGSRTFIQPILEWRSALEHIVRARAEEMRIRNPNAAPDGEYVRANLDKALGHEHRAFFDTADWLGAIIRERVIDSVGPYSVECITQVMPDYYKTIRPELERANREIAEIRERKDIAHGDMLMEQVENYTAVLEKLLARHKEMLATIPSFEECSKKLRRSGFCKRAWDIVVGIIAGAFVGYLLSRFPSASGKASP